MNPVSMPATLITTITSMNPSKKQTLKSAFFYALVVL